MKKLTKLMTPKKKLLHYLQVTVGWTKEEAIAEFDDMVGQATHGEDVSVILEERGYASNKEFCHALENPNED